MAGLCKRLHFQLLKLSGQTMLLLDQGRNIQIEGAAGAFDKEFRAMEDNLEEIRKIIDGAGVSTIDVEELENMLKEIRYFEILKFSDS